jgi:hypothetical protein
MKKNPNNDTADHAIEPRSIAVYLSGHINNVSLDEKEDRNTSYFNPSIVKCLKMRHMIHKRFVFETCGVGIQWFATIQEFCRVILGAVEGARSLWFEVDKN